MDQYFTPAQVASNSFLGLKKKGIKTVADFSVGDGSLLQALPFKPKEIIGLDIDKKILRKLRNKYPFWNLHSGNFLDPNRQTLKWLQQWEENIDLIVLNPPFSCRGGRRFDIIAENEHLKCRTALAFVVKALKYLSFNGRLIAILPLSCFKSEADKTVIAFLKKNWSLEFGTKLDHNTFIGCSPNSILLSIERKKNEGLQIFSPKRKEAFAFHAEILRGSVSMYKTKESGKYEVIHSTNLQKGLLDLGRIKYYDVKVKCVEGTYLCIPRVGRPNKGKLVIVHSNQQYILSDCVIALRGRSHQETYELRQIFFQNWSAFLLLYESTCAPYITISQIREFLAINNIETDVVNTFPSEKRESTKQQCAALEFV